MVFRLRLPPSSTFKNPAVGLLVLRVLHHSCKGAHVATSFAFKDANLSA